ncbi:MAG: hypothetical protein HIU92_12030 [Proteobacteria bacterium]|nr:hypothetical protein [Pseudomonadota bacterium]
MSVAGAATGAEGWAADPMALPSTDWLRHTLAVTGPAEDVARLAAAAEGSGVIPWFYPDLDTMEEDQRLALLRPPDGSPGLPPAAARVLARQLREAVARRHEQVMAAAAAGRGCAFDLHALLPVPGAILRRGPADPAARAWMRAQWGVIQPLRRVERLPGSGDGRRRRAARIDYGFWSADWTPWAAISTLREAWPHLAFDIRPQYDDARD